MTAARRLVAILAADMVGYSRLMGEDQAGTARAAPGEFVFGQARGRQAEATLFE